MYMWENLDVLVEIPDVHVLILRQLPVFAASITIPPILACLLSAHDAPVE